MPADDSISDQDTIASVVSAYRAAWIEVDAISTAAPLDQPRHDVGAEAMGRSPMGPHALAGGDRPPRWTRDVLLELVDGTAGR